MALITIVNDKDEVIGTKERAAITHDDIYRVSSLWITNNKGEILLAQRAFTNTHSPGKWGPAVAGTVEADETYESNIVKEMGEELGLHDVRIRKGEKTFRNGEQWRYFGQRFYATVDKPINQFIVQQEEIASIRWISLEKLREELAAHPDDFLRSIPEFVNER